MPALDKFIKIRTSIGDLAKDAGANKDKVRALLIEVMEHENVPNGMEKAVLGKHAEKFAGVVDKLTADMAKAGEKMAAAVDRIREIDAEL